MKITENIMNVGFADKDLDIFEGQYPLKDGVTYNSYIILDEKIAIMDTVDKRASEEWLANIETALAGKEPDYLIISHMEPDHSYNIKTLAEKYPNMKLVSNAKVFAFIPQFFDIKNLAERQIVVGENSTLDLGTHQLRFIMAPMVHWPEVMMEYEETEKLLFTADAFGKFGIVHEIENEETWLDEARRYYINIVGKYGVQVQALLKKVASLEIQKICPLHGPVLTENLKFYIDKYDTWSKYEPESDGVLIACGSMHDFTMEVCTKLEELLKESGKAVKLIDLTRADITEAVGEAFKYKNLVVASPTYNAELMPVVEYFLRLLKSKGYQNRRVAYIENGTWAPMAAKFMMEITSGMKNIENVEPIVTVRTRMNEEVLGKLEELRNHI
ncbi:MAG: FprA family A-type flavoprotein [Clostridia bacterium]|nr:FprA family A-type flavoprotein [Clostridia bacterium]